MLPSVFSYTDYRKYLADYYTDRKSASATFSFTTLSQKAGFKNRGFLHTVIHGSRNLSKPSIVMLCQALGHTSREADYFENLVFFNQAQDLKQRNYFFEKLQATMPKSKATQQLRNDQFEFYSTWYHSAIRSLVDLYPVKEDYKWIAKSLYPAITSRQAKKSVALLQKLGLIQKQKNGVFKLTTKSITTGDEVKGLAVLNFHREATQLAQQAMDELPPAKRNITGLTLGLSVKAYNKICADIADFRAKVVQLVEQDEEADRTYQLNFHFFPITRTDLKEKKA